jgi:2-haloacid dehalogenase
MAERAALFDAMGTLFDLQPLRVVLGPVALEAWFQRLLQSAATLTFTGAFRPFPELAASTLATTRAKLELDVDEKSVLAGLSELPAYPDAATALRELRDAGVRVAVLTNGAAENTKKLLDSAGLLDDVATVFTTADVDAYKPDPRPYRHAVGGLGLPAQSVTMIAAHGWDVLGALAAGLQAIWVDRDEREWAFPTPEPRRAGSLVEAARLVAA